MFSWVASGCFEATRNVVAGPKRYDMSKEDKVVDVVKISGVESMYNRELYDRELSCEEW